MVGDDTGDVIRPRFGSTTEIEQPDRFCRHVSVLISEKRRVVRCRTCEAVLDPFTVILEYARRERAWHNWDAASREKRTEIDALKAEERRIKARIKTARGKTGAGHG